jgi:hypothetical protein
MSAMTCSVSRMHASARSCGSEGCTVPIRRPQVVFTVLPLLLASLHADAEIFVDLGAGYNHVDAKIANIDDRITTKDGSLHLGVGARRLVGERSDVGVRLEFDTINSESFMAVRAIDYRRHVSELLAVGFFLGAARYDLATPAYGYYVGAGVSFKEILPRWDLGVDFRLGDKVARDNVLPSDPQGGSPDNFYDVTGLSVYLSYRF